MENSCEWYDPSCWLKWLSDELKALWLWLYDGLLSGLAKLVEILPVPDFLSNAQVVSISSTVSWFVEPFNFKYGLSIIVGAYIARFILRRIPFIG